MPPIIAAGKFQFHKGTIKTILCRPKRQGEQKFQFHKGTIKTLQECACRSSDYNFNSIKVQLRLN